MFGNKCFANIFRKKTLETGLNALLETTSLQATVHKHFGNNDFGNNGFTTCLNNDFGTAFTNTVGTVIFGKWFYKCFGVIGFIKTWYAYMFGNHDFGHITLHTLL